MRSGVMPSRIRHTESRKSPPIDRKRGPFAVGLLNGLMPCRRCSSICTSKVIFPEYNGGLDLSPVALQAW